MSNPITCPDCGSTIFMRDTVVNQTMQDIVQPDSVVSGQLTTPTFDMPDPWTCENGHIQTTPESEHLTDLIYHYNHDR